jgi:hypothetical protein
MRKVFEEVRTEFDIPEPRRPLVYRGERGKHRAWNSGGRSLVFEQDGKAYRVKGVDPYGALTGEVAASGKNRIEDTLKAIAYVNGTYRTDEPFGTLLPKKANNERVAMQLLAKDYAKRKVEYPCLFERTVNVKKGEVQNWFRLRRMEDDLRLEELDQVMIQRMKSLSREQLEDCHKDVLKLYGRLNIWAGLAMRTMVDCKLRPSAISFLPQNYVIARAGDGYGMFRVDHTSTLHVPDMTEGEIFDGLQAEVGQGGLEQCVVLRFPTAVLIAMDPGQADQRLLDREIRSRGSLLEGAYYYMGPIKSSDDVQYMHYLNTLVNAFAGGFGGATEPIEESRFRKFVD